MNDYDFEAAQKKHEEFLKNLDRKATLPPGKYWIGDPCYFADDANNPEGYKYWHNILAKTVEPSPGTENDVWFGYGVFPTVNSESEKKEGYILCASTIHGDGGYLGSNGFEYSVDAGLLGAFAVDCAVAPIDTCKRLGTLFVAEEPLEVSYTRKRISFRSGDQELIIYINA